ncbi:MAG: hypothetical protein DWQ01_10025 [Planctomycetota bacterium]|nr:MAG: hypothetical protein DWQ01_10025 [Planctomycetota bacterium]
MSLSLRSLPCLFAASLGLAGSALAQGPVAYDSGQPGILSDTALVQPGAGSLGGQAFSGQAIQGTPAWYVLARPLTARSRCGSATIGGKDFYVIGGEIAGGGRADRVEIWDRQTDTWSQSHSVMPVPVSNVMGSCVFSGGLMYVFGGTDVANQPVDLVQVFDPFADSWTVHPTRLPRPMFGVGVSNIGGGEILVCGGADLNFYYDDSWLFETWSGTFQPGSPMAHADYLITITSTANFVDAKVYMTGFATSTFLQSFDLASGQFQTAASFRNDPVFGQDRAGCGMDNVGPRVFVYGGDWTGFRADCESYEIPSGQVVARPSLTLNVGRRSFAYGPLPCPGCYVSGGWNGTLLQHAEGAR